MLAWALHSLERDVGRREWGHWGTLSDSAREWGVPLIAVRRGDRAPSSTPLSISHPTWSQWAGSHVTEKKVLALIGVWKRGQSSEVQQCSSNALSVAIVICASSPEVFAEYSVLTWMCLHEVSKIRAHIEIFVVSWQRTEKQMLRFFIRPTNNLSCCHRCDHTVLSVWWFAACALPLRKNTQKSLGRLASTTARYPVLCVELETFKKYFLTPGVKTTWWSWDRLFSCHVSLLSNAHPSSVCTSGDLIKHVEGRIDSYLIHPRMA